jgi:Flp pilus assembly CpaF family ATPase
MDYELVQRLRSTVADALRTERRNLAERGEAAMTGDEERELGRSLVLEALTAYRREQLLTGGAALPPAEDDAPLAEAVHAALFTLGRLQPLIEDPALNNIEINGHDRVWLYRTDGRVVQGPAVADSDSELVDWVRTAATYAGLSSRPFDPVHPWLEVRLPDGSRLCALMSVVERPAVSIRLYRHQRVLLDDLRALDAFSEELHAFLTAAVHGRFNLMVSGETFAGKTTLLRALGNAIPYEERLVTAEHFLELGFQHLPDLHRDVVAMEERLPNNEGAGGLSLSALVERSRRMNPDRIIVGEVIGAEIIAMLDAMSQGEDGSLSTIHARDSRMVFQRIASYALTSPARLPVEASGMLTAGALDFVVHMTKARLSDGRIHRYVSSVREVLGFDGTQVISSEVFACPPGQIQAGPAAPISEPRTARLAAAGYDPRASRVLTVAGR